MSLNAKSILPADLASRAAALSLAANFGLMIIKITVGLITGSIAVLSDGIDSAQDMLAAGIVLASVRIGRRPADPEHTFGHGRAETIAAAIQALMIGVGATYIAFSAVSRLTNPPDQIGTDLGLATMLLAALVNLIGVRYVANAARITRSPAIASDARHLWTNVVQAVAVLTGLGLVALTGEVAFDAILALSLALYLFWTSGRILASAANDILDASLSAEEVRFVEAAILSQGDAISGFHQLRTRRSGQIPHIDFHLLFPSSATITTAHSITESIEAQIRARWPDAEILIHEEPAVGSFRSPDGSESGHG